MVHRDGQAGPRRQDSPRTRHEGHFGHRVLPADGPQPPVRHGREPARLADLAPAQLGRADHPVRQRQGRAAHRRPAARSGGQAQRQHQGRHRENRRGRMVRDAQRRFLRRHGRLARRLGKGHRRPRRLVRFRHDPRLRPAQTRHHRQRHGAGGRLHGRLRPAPRLVPVLAARVLRHARHGALQAGRHPRHGRRCRRQEDVEIDRQHDRARRVPETARHRDPPPLDGLGRLLGRHPHLRRDHQGHGRDLPQASQHAALHARRAGRLHARRSHRRQGHARPRTLHPPPPRRTRRRSARRLQGVRLQARDDRHRQLRERRTLGRLFRHPQGRALLRPVLRRRESLGR